MGPLLLGRGRATDRGQGQITSVIDPDGKCDLCLRRSR